MFGNLLHLWIISLTLPSLFQIVYTLPYRSQNCFNNCDKYRIVLAPNGTYVYQRITTTTTTTTTTPTPVPASSPEEKPIHQFAQGNEVNFNDSSYHHNRNNDSMITNNYLSTNDVTTTTTKSMTITATTQYANSNSVITATNIANTIINRVKRQDRISFPGNEIPSSCDRNLTFCEKLHDDDYKPDEVDEMIQANLMKYEALFGRDEIKENGISIVNRLGEKFDDELLCEAHEKLVYPQYGQGVEKWEKLVNSKKFEQGVRVEVCDHYESNQPPASCRYSGNFPNGKRAKCIQKFAYREMLSVRDGTPVKIPILLPSCCQCIVQAT